MTLLPSEVKDTEQLITFDICNLYSNISQELGLEAMKYWLSKHPENTTPRRPDEFIIERLKIILENNSFEFGDKNFLQIFGRAMGTKMAPTYANLILVPARTVRAKRGRSSYPSIVGRNTVQYNSDLAGKFETSWKRYIDDCFLLWDTAVDEGETKNLTTFNHD